MAKNYSNEELKDLLQLVAEHPNNFQEAFRLHSTATGRSVAGIKQKFQSYRRKSNAKVCMATVSNNKTILNRKVVTDVSTVPVTTTKKSIWQKILSMFTF